MIIISPSVIKLVQLIQLHTLSLFQKHYFLQLLTIKKMEASISVGSMLQMWRDFNLSSLQSDLDLMASQVAERQDESVVSRKKLVTESKAFNKSMPDDVKKIVNPLIKLFQGEIDKLSKRSKAAETAFLSSYKRILEVPDPVPALDVGDILQRQIQRQHDAETENAKLRDTIEQYKKDFADKKQQERELASLKSKVEELEEDLEKESNERAIKKEKELSTKFAEKEATARSNVWSETIIFADISAEIFILTAFHSPRNSNASCWKVGNSRATSC